MKKMSGLRMSIAAVSLAAALCLALPVLSAQAADPIIIGVPTSTNLLEGKESLNCIKLAVDQINAAALQVQSTSDSISEDTMAMAQEVDELRALTAQLREPSG